MKRFFIILSVLFSVVNFSLANSSFDVTKNYQANNAKAYEGELLTVAPLPGYDKVQYYNYFMDFDSFDDSRSSENSLYEIYCSTGRCGTEPRFLTGKTFRVDKVKQLRDYEYTWVFYLTNISNYGDKVKFIYHGDPQFHKGAFKNFPFYTKKYIDHVKSELYNKNVIVSTVKQTFAVWENNYVYKALCNTDLNGNKIKYDKPYAKYKVTGFDLDPETSEIVLLLSNGSVKTKELYSLHYEKNPIIPSIARIFTEKEWNDCISKYGQSHMEAIMSGDIIEGMTYEECVLAHSKHRKSSIGSKYDEFTWLFGYDNYRKFTFDKNGNMIGEGASEVCTIKGAVKDIFRAIF